MQSEFNYDPALRDTCIAFFHDYWMETRSSNLVSLELQFHSSSQRQPEEADISAELQMYPYFLLGVLFHRLVVK